MVRLQALGPARQRLRRICSAEFRDFWLIVGNGVLVRLYFEVFSAKRVVAAFLTELTGREWLVGLAVAAPTLFACGPALYYSYRMEGASRRMPYYAWGARIKWVSQLSLLLAVVLLPGWPMALALVFIFFYGLFGLGDAVGLPAFGDVVARTIAAHRRGRLFGLRVALGGLLALGAGLWIGWVLDPRSGLSFPNNYLLLFAVAFAFLVAAQFLFMRVDEPELARPDPPPASLRDYLANTLVILRQDQHVLRFCVYRNLSPWGWVPAAFLIPYALKELGFQPSVVGVIVTTSVIASSFSNLYWGSLGDKRGNSYVLRWSALVLLLAAATLAAAPWLAARWSQSAMLYWLVLTNALGEIGLIGMGNGQLNYQYDLAPDDQVPMYVAAIATAAAPMLIAAPLVMGALAGRLGHEVVFVIGLVASVAVWWSTLGLQEPRRPMASRARERYKWLRIIVDERLWLPRAWR